MCLEICSAFMAEHVQPLKTWLNAVSGSFAEQTHIGLLRRGARSNTVAPLAPLCVAHPGDLVYSSCSCSPSLHLRTRTARDVGASFRQTALLLRSLCNSHAAAHHSDMHTVRRSDPPVR